MSMSIQEAIKRINEHMSIHPIGQYPHIYLAEAMQMAIDALREKAERENAPTHYTVKADLTDEQIQKLKNMLSGAGSIMVASDNPPSVEIIPRWIPVTERLPEPPMEVQK